MHNYGHELTMQFINDLLPTRFNSPYLQVPLCRRLTARLRDGLRAHAPKSTLTRLQRLPHASPSAQSGDGQRAERHRSHAVGWRAEVRGVRAITQYLGVAGFHDRHSTWLWAGNAEILAALFSYSARTPTPLLEDSCYQSTTQSDQVRSPHSVESSKAETRRPDSLKIDPFIDSAISTENATGDSELPLEERPMGIVRWVRVYVHRRRVQNGRF